MSEKFTVEVDIRAKDSTGKALANTKRGFKDTFQDIASGALRFAGESLAGFASQIPGMIVDLGKLGIESQAASQRFERFAGGADQAAMFLESFDKGTENTVDRMAAMTSAGRLLQMGLVDTGDEMQQISSIATKLGDQTMGAGDRIADFAALLANQSIPRLDNFGISSGRVKKRIDELLKSGQALDRERAFKMAVMEEGAKSLQRLGDTSDTAASKIAVTTAAWKDTKIAIGGAVLSLAQASGALDAVSSFAKDISGTTEAIEKQGFTVEAWAKAVAVFVTSGSRSEALQEFRRQLELTSESYDHQSSEIERYASTLKQAAEIGRFNRAEVEQQTTSYTELSFVSDEVKASLDDQVVSQGLMLHTILQATEALEAETGAMDDFVGGMDAAAQLSLSMSFTGQLEQMEEAAAGFAKKREDIEAGHQEKLAELQKRGQATSVRLNETAELDKLANLQFSMEQAQRRFEEMSGKEKESARLAKENTLAQATEKFQTQQQLLDDFHAGRLVKAGENVGALIAVEDQRHQAALAGLDEEMQKQQEIQEKALGNMVLQSFDSWSEQKDIPVDKMLEMRTGIAEEFGLVSEGATELVTDMVGEWDRWATNTNIATEDVVDLMGQVITETGKVDKALLDLTTEEYVIKVRYELSGRPPTAPDGTTTGGTGGTGGPGGGIPMANGGQFMVGERGPEIVTVSPMSGPTYNDTFNVYDTGAMSAVQDQRRRERRQELARTM